jgi:homoserine dehydrogenase
VKKALTTHVIQLGYGKVGAPLVHLAVENRARIELETGVHLEYAAMVRSSSAALGDDLAQRATDRGSAFDQWTPRAPGMALDVLDPVFNRFGLPDTTRYVLVDVTATAETGHTGRHRKQDPTFGDTRLVRAGTSRKPAGSHTVPL